MCSECTRLMDGRSGGSVAPEEQSAGVESGVTPIEAVENEDGTVTMTLPMVAFEDLRTQLMAGAVLMGGSAPFVML